MLSANLSSAGGMGWAWSVGNNLVPANYETGKTASIQAAINLSGPVFAPGGGDYLVESTLDLHGKGLDLKGCRFKAAPSLAGPMFTNVGNNVQNLYVEGNPGYPILHYPGAFYHCNVQNVYFKGGTLIQADDITVGSNVSNVFGSVIDRLIDSKATGVSTTLSTTNIYLNYHSKFIKYAGELFGHEMKAVILENGNGQQFEMTAAYQYVSVDQFWVETNVAGRVMDMNPGVGQEYYSMIASNVRFIAAGPVTPPTNTEFWSKRGVNLGRSSITLGSPILNESAVFSAKGIDLSQSNIGFNAGYNWKISMPDTNPGRTNDGVGFEAEVSNGTSGRLSGVFGFTTRGVASSFWRHDAAGKLIAPPVFQYGESPSNSSSTSGSLVNVETFETIFTFPSSAYAAKVFLRLGAADRNCIMTCLTIINGVITNDAGGAVSNRVQMVGGTQLQVKAQFGTYGLAWNLRVDYVL